MRDIDPPPPASFIPYDILYVALIINEQRPAARRLVHKPRQMPAGLSAQQISGISRQGSSQYSEGEYQQYLQHASLSG